MKKVIICILCVGLFNCEEIINEQNITKETVEILAPTSNSTIIEGPISFDWVALEGSSDYRLQLATPTFKNAIQIVLDTTISKTNFSQTLIKNNYEWRVKALNSAYETAYTMNGFVVE